MPARGHPRRLGGERRLADPGVALDDERPRAPRSRAPRSVRDAARSGSRATTRLASARRGASGGADRHRLGAPLHQHGRAPRTRSSRPPPARSPRRTGSRRRRRHEARRQVGDVAVQHVLAPQVVAEEPAERAAAGHADRARQAEVAELAPARRGGTDARLASSSCARGGSPNTPDSVRPLLSTGLAGTLEARDRLLEGAHGEVRELDVAAGVQQPAPSRP